MTDTPALPKLLGPVRVMVEKVAPGIGYTAEDLAKLVLETEREVPGEFKGQVDRQWGALYGVLCCLQPAAVEEVFVPAGKRRKKSDVRAVAPAWAPKTFGTAVVETTFKTFDDGRIIEEIDTRPEPSFVVYTPVPEKWEIAPEVEVDGTRYIPRPIAPEFLEILTLADGVERYESPAALLAEMTQLGLDVFDPGDDLPLFLLTVRLAFASWAVSGLFPPRYLGGTADRFLPGLQVIGLPQTGKGRRLIIAQHLFYRTIYLLATVRVPSIFRTLSPWGWGSTLICDEADLPYSGTNSEMVEFLNARCYGRPPVRYNADKDVSVPFLSFGYTILATREAYEDPGWSSRVIPLNSAASLKKKEPPLIVDKAWEDRAAKLRRRLLLFRFRMLEAIRRGDVRLPEKVPLARHFEPRLRAAFLPLFALAQNDGGLTTDAVALATEIGRRQTARRADSWEGTVIGALYEKISDKTWTPAPRTDRPGDKMRRLTFTTKVLRPKVVDGKQDGTDEAVEATDVVTLSTLRGALGGDVKGQAVSRVLKSIQIEIETQDRVGPERRKRILEIPDPDRLVDAFSKYVVDAELADIRLAFGLPSEPSQRVLDGAPEGGPGG